MKQVKYAVKPNVTIRNTRTGDVVRGSIIDEQEIDLKKYWVVSPENRPASRLMFAKDAWSILKGKS